jgi:hypothetical protein
MMFWTEPPTPSVFPEKVSERIFAQFRENPLGTQAVRDVMEYIKPVLRDGAHPGDIPDKEAADVISALFMGKDFWADA